MANINASNSSGMSKISSIAQTLPPTTQSLPYTAQSLPPSIHGSALMQSTSGSSFISNSQNSLGMSSDIFSSSHQPNHHHHHHNLFFQTASNPTPPFVSTSPSQRSISKIASSSQKVPPVKIFQQPQSSLTTASSFTSHTSNQSSNLSNQFTSGQFSRPNMAATTGQPYSSFGYQSQYHQNSVQPATLNGLPFSRDLLPHSYFKLSVSSYGRSIREDTAADEENLMISTPTLPGANLTTFVLQPSGISLPSTNNSLSWCAMDMSGVGLRQLSRTSPIFGIGFGFSSLAFSLTGLYLTANMLREIPPEIGLLKNLTVLHLAFNRLVALTPAIGFCTQLKELLLQGNELTSLPSTIGNLHRLKSLNLEGNSWNDPMLLSILANIGILGGGNINAAPGSSLNNQHPSILASRTASLVIPFLRDNAPVSVSLPPPRRWESFNAGATIDKQMFFDPPISFLSWNILAEIYADPSRYGYTPSWALSWPYRQESIIQTLRASGADIIALQEVEGAVFSSILESLRSDAACMYEGIFQPKHRFRTIPSSDSKSTPVDGVAIFWHSGKFTLEQASPIEFCSPSLLSDKASTPTLQSSVSGDSFSFLDQGSPILVACSDLFNRSMLKDNVALLARFKRLDCQSRAGIPSSSCPSLIVGSVHLQWDEAFKDVKMLQASILSQRLTHMIPSGGNDSSSTPSIILAGDFNSDINSGAYSIISQGNIPVDHVDWQGYSYPPFTAINHNLKKGIPLQSAYHFDMDINKNTEDGRLSTFTDTFSGLIDHVFVSESNLQVTGRLTLPNHNDPSLEGLVGMPSIHFPSDHFPLMIEFVQKVPIGKDEIKLHHSSSGKNTIRASR